MQGGTFYKPELSDFGITTKQYGRYRGQHDDEPSGIAFGVAFAVVLLAIVVVVYLVTGEVRSAIIAGVVAITCFPMTGGVAYLLGAGITLAYSRLSKVQVLPNSVIIQIKAYEEAKHAYQMALAQAEQERVAAVRERERQARERHRIEEMRSLRQREKWTSLSGEEFEKALGQLLEDLGYSTHGTPRTGDEGIDLIVRRGTKTTVVQCKQHKKPVGPAVVRELYGAMIAYGADQALLACTAGFTRGAEAFARKNHIFLWSLDQLLYWAAQANNLIDSGSDTLPPKIS